MEVNPDPAGAIDPGASQLDTKQLRPWPLAITALALGGLGDLLLFHPRPGLGTTLFLLLLAAAFGGLLRIHGLRPRSGLWMGVGGSFDVWAGMKKRAPGWMGALQIEWLYRLLQEPQRWRRMLALPEFAWAILRGG